MTHFSPTPSDPARAGIAFADDLLRPAPLRLEAGISRLDSGALVVAMRTDLHGCKGRMLEWWFKQFDTTEHLKWWHPIDHLEHRGWDRHWQKGRSYIGATIRAVESLGDIPPVAAVIKFHDPEEVFTPALYRQAVADGHVSAAVYARIGFGDDVPLTESGDPADQMVHVVRDTSYGAVLRSRFILGQTAAETGHTLPDAIGFGLMQHCYAEFTYLSKVLPSLYWADPANRADVPVLW